MQYEIITIDDEKLKRIQNLSEFTIENIEITSDEEYKNVCELLKKVKGKTKEIKEFFKTPKAEANKNHKDIISKENELTNKLTDFEEKAKESIGSYQQLQENHRTIDNPLTAPKVKGISSSDKYEWEIVDKSIIPSQYFMSNEKLINSTIRDTDGSIDIPGIRIITKKSVRARSE